MKKLFVAALIVLGFTSLVSAQTSASVGAPISVVIKQALSITELGSLSFGTAYPGYSVAEVNPQIANPSSIPVFTIAGEASTPVTITWSNISLVNGASSVPFEPIVAGNPTNTQTGSSVLSSGAAPSLSAIVGGTNFGNYYLFLGGNINSGSTLPAALPSGTYSGTLTVNVAY